jgi:hypothetical protein
MFIDYLSCSGRICNEHGDYIPSDSPPVPCPSDRGPDDWTPYNNQIKFEVTNFLYCWNQMSSGDIDFISNLWAASLAIHDDVSPFTNHADMYDAINSTTLGNVAWESFSLQYNGVQPEGKVPPWMTAEYDVWFCDP